MGCGWVCGDARSPVRCGRGEASVKGGDAVSALMIAAGTAAGLAFAEFSEGAALALSVFLASKSVGKRKYRG